ncbi:MAG: serine hydrolase domain-containing protein [Maribacter sp.]
MEKPFMTTTKLILSLFTIIFYVNESNAQVSKERLIVGNRFQSEIKLGSEYRYELPLGKGQFALIDLEQKGVDVKISTCAPDGKVIEEFDSPNGAIGNEIILIDATESGLYTLEVTPLEEKAKKKKGKYSIELIATNKTINSHLDSSFELVESSNYLPGFFVSIINNEKVLYTNGQGFANIKDQIPYTKNTIQQIESISKTFLGLAIMLLVEEGKLDLDGDINEYLPFKVRNPHFLETPITLRQLATHTAAIDDREKQDNFAWIENKEIFDENKAKYIHKKRRKYYQSLLNNTEITMKDFLKSFFVPNEKNYSKNNFLKNKPGEQWYYSNIGATLAAYIIELVSKQPYSEFVEQRVISPLKLQHTTWGYGLGKDAIHALKYGGGKNEYPRITSPTYPDGGIYSSTNDLSKYLMHWIKGYSGKKALLESSSYKELMNVQFEATDGQFKGIKNGLFWWIFKENRMGHNGGNMGSNANIFFYPELGVGYTSLENMSYGESEGAMLQSDRIKQILNRYLKYFSNE